MTPRPHPERPDFPGEGSPPDPSTADTPPTIASPYPATTDPPIRPDTGTTPTDQAATDSQIPAALQAATTDPRVPPAPQPSTADPRQPINQGPRQTTTGTRHPDAPAVPRSADHEAEAVVATRGELAALRDPPVPPELARRWAAAIDAEHAVASGGAARPEAPNPDDPPTSTLCREHDQRSGDAAAPGEGPDSTTTRPARGRGPGGRGRVGPPPSGPPRRPAPLWRRPAVVAAALLAAVAAAAGLTHRSPEVGSRTLAADGLASIGLHDAGDFEDPGRRATCLRALAPPGVAPTAPLVGGRRVTFDGRDGVLLALGTGRRGVFDVVVVDPACTALLDATRVGG